jgi:PAS domain S-box-containing protein
VLLSSYNFEIALNIVNYQKKIRDFNMKHRYRCFRLLSVSVLISAGCLVLCGASPPVQAAGGEAGGTGLAVSGLTIALWITSLVSLAVAVFSLIRLYRLKTQAAGNRKLTGPGADTYQMMVENAEEGILVIQQLEIKYANQKTYDLMGVSRENRESTQLADYLYPQDMDIVLENYEKVIFAQEEIRRFSARVLTADQNVIWINARFVPVTWENAPAVLASISDITALKLLEKDLHQAQRMEAIGALSGGIAHDFNNILTTIIGSAEVAQMDLAEDAPAKKEFEQIRKSGYRARDLVRQILTISRENAQDVQPIYLMSMIKEALKLLRSTLPKEIRIKENIDRNVSLVKADSIQLYQVFMNLCTNAKDALKEAGDPCLEITLKNETVYTSGVSATGCLKPGNYVMFSVRDNGEGVEPDVADRIFEPYFTTKNTKTRTGLGLATTMGIVKQYGGHIRFESASETGTCFQVYLPEYQPDKGGAETCSDPVRGGGRILFIDDEPEITVIAQRMFKHLGFSVMTVDSGRKALELFSRSPEFFDVVITDLSMPGMSGKTVAESVLRIRPEIPVIMCTGHSDTFDETDAKKAGISAYIRKPYDFKKLSSMAASFIKKSKAA